MNFMSGRALFQFNPDLFAGDEDDADVIDIEFEEDEEESKAAQQGASDDEEYKREDDEEEKKEDEPASVQVDKDLFAGENAAADEEVDFD